MVERNKAVNISEIIIAIAFTVTKNNFLTNVPSKHNRAISKHKNTVTAIFEANGKKQTCPQNIQHNGSTEIDKK